MKKKYFDLFESFKLFNKKSSALIACLFILLSSDIKAQTFPAGFSQVKVATIYYPTSMAVAPDGRIFVTEKAGNVKIIKNGAVLGTPFLHVNVDELNERGLSSIAIDPNFNTNHYVYIYYTTASSPIHNRLSRFTANGDVAVAGSELQILNFENCVNSIHNSGGMAFGPDGKLYIGVGNDNVNSNSQNLNNYMGKILRINPDGSVPSGNPFSGSESAKRIWAYGLRNPWSIDIQPGTGKIYVNDVGEGAWEEIDNATTAGKNFGWPASEGATTNPAYTTPVYTYHHGTNGSSEGCAITGGVFFNPATTNYPAQYTGKYFFIDYCGKWINYLDGNTKYNFATNLPSSCNYIKVGKDGNLYYFSIGQSSLYKIIYNNNNAPSITAQPVNKTVSQGQPVTFNVSAAGATPLNYQWKKNGTNISGANSASYTINNAQAADAGQYSVVVSNNYGNVTSNSATLTVTAYNAKPVAVIQTPAAGTLYRGGTTINFSGDATDQEEGTLPASAFSWVVEFHHDAHIHPGPSIPQGVKTGSFAISATGEASANVYYRLLLIVEDSHGLADTAFVDIHPKTSTISLASQPAGLQLLLNGQPHTTAYSVAAVSGTIHTLGLNTPQTLNGTSYVFSHWIHGGNASQNVTITDNNTTYTAVFTASGTGTTCTASGNITRDYWGNITGTSLASVPFNSTPQSTSLLNIFEGPTNAGSNYGSRIRGYICAPATGSYTFWIASDDNSELWLSTTDQPANKVKIAGVSGYTAPREWTKYGRQQSVAINLTAGKKYYIEALHKEGLEGDNLAVGWKLPNGTLERPIPGSRLSPFGSSSGTSAPTVNITSPTNNTNYPSPANITFNTNVNANGGTITKVEFFNGAGKIGEATTSPYSFTWMNVTTGNYSITAKAINSSGQTGTSAAINVIVTSCPTPIITASGPTTMCSGSVTLYTGTGTGYMYQWKKDGVDISGATNSSYTASSTGDYQVKVIHGSCISWSAPTRVTIQNSLSASITPGGPTTFCSGGNVKLYANTCSGYTYQWKKNNVNISGATGAVYTATTSGSYQVQITQAGNNAWSALVNVTVNSCREPSDSVSTEENANNGMREASQTTETAIETANSTDPILMKVFPNPNTGLFTLLLNMPKSGDELIKMTITNVLGQEIFKKQLLSTGDYIQETIELDQSLPAGVYTLQVIIGNKAENTSIVLSK